MRQKFALLRQLDFVVSRGCRRRSVEQLDILPSDTLPSHSLAVITRLLLCCGQQLGIPEHAADRSSERIGIPKWVEKSPPVAEQFLRLT